MTLSSANMPNDVPSDGLVPLDEVFRDVPPVRSADDLAQDGIFDTDEELDEFIEFTYAARRADVA